MYLPDLFCGFTSQMQLLAKSKRFGGNKDLLRGESRTKPVRDEVDGREETERREGLCKLDSTNSSSNLLLLIERDELETSA